MNTAQQYNLVYITTGGEYKTPNGASLLFDNAQYHAANKTKDTPTKTEVWIIGNMLEYIDIPTQSIITELMLKCPDIIIRTLNGIKMLQSFPILALLKFYRKLIGSKTPVVYVCRGTDANMWAIKLQHFFPNDMIVIDVREYPNITAQPEADIKK